MKKITLLIPDKYSDILSATMVGVRYHDDDNNSTTYLTTCNIVLRDHNNDTYVINNDNGGWIDEVSIEE